ncbi:hypothetical protein Pfo_018990 [Paulownia fortunei]|nr:hypothetical protein Pfo_018990 [Paulownia fortunei]
MPTLFRDFLYFNFTQQLATQPHVIRTKSQPQAFLHTSRYWVFGRRPWPLFHMSEDKCLGEAKGSYSHQFADLKFSRLLVKWVAITLEDEWKIRSFGLD